PPLIHSLSKPEKFSAPDSIFRSRISHKDHKAVRECRMLDHDMENLEVCKFQENPQAQPFL
ncbi:hypothetical protein L0244_09155, partial [bacterium]|nr:hypothetical protein [bacterium]